MRLSAPSKINLFLHILGKRPDGFHEVETLMCPLSLSDEVILEKAKTICLEIEGNPDIPTDESNLAFKAARAVQRVARIGKEEKGARIVLKKNIPAGGGLAGGSSNAVAVIQGLNLLWECGLSESQLHEIAASLGSDLNFFLEGGPALCQGRGEKTELVEVVMEGGEEHKEDWGILLINPGFEVSTPWAYQEYAKKPSKGKEGRIKGHYEKGKGGDGKGVFDLRNDLERPVFEKYVWLKEAKIWLQKRDEVVDALMSGSGATLFALTSTIEEAERLVEPACKYFGERAWIRAVQLLTKKGKGSELCQ